MSAGRAPPFRFVGARSRRDLPGRILAREFDRQAMEPSHHILGYTSQVQELPGTVDRRNRDLGELPAADMLDPAVFPLHLRAGALDLDVGDVAVETALLSLVETSPEVLLE